jgi:integrase
MPAEARGHVRKLPSGLWQLRSYRDGRRRSGGAFPTKSAALNHFRDVVEAELRGHAVRAYNLTLSDLVDVFLERHGKVRSPRTIQTIRERLRRPLDRFADVPLSELESMTDEVAGFSAQLPYRYRYSVMSAFRQVLGAGIRYGYMTRNPAKASGANPQPPPRQIRVFPPDELRAICSELDKRGAAAVRFAAATGLRPAEWAHLEWSDVDKGRRTINVRGTKTVRSRREVPLAAAALAALDSLTVRRHSRYVFAGPKRGAFDQHNFRRRQWVPAVESAGIPTPARIYDLRSTFASNALAAGITVYELGL